MWCRDFIVERTGSGSQLEWLSVVDEFTRECLVLKVDRGITSGDAIDTLAELFAMRGVPKHVRSDNGPEVVAKELRARLARLDVSTLSIEPGSPWENGCAKSSRSRFRDECSALEGCEDLRDATAITAARKGDHHRRMPHSALGYQTPSGFAAACATPGHGLRSSRTRCFPWSTLFLSPHIAWYRKSNPLTWTHRELRRASETLPSSFSFVLANVWWINRPPLPKHQAASGARGSSGPLGKCCRGP